MDNRKRMQPNKNGRNGLAARFVGRFVGRSAGAIYLLLLFSCNFIWGSRTKIIKTKVAADAIGDRDKAKGQG